MAQSILFIDDEKSFRMAFSEYLSDEGYECRTAASLAEARAAMAESSFDAIFLDINLPDGSGLDWLPGLREAYPDIAIVVITGYGDIPTAVEAMRMGADNFLAKPLDFGKLGIVIAKCMELVALRKGRSASQRIARQNSTYFGVSPAIKAVLDLARVAAANDSPVLILGETGTGKGLLARWIHEHSWRSQALFVELNCSALKGELLGSELFGHARGAFTGAVQDRQGLIEAAEGGTLFLDEIADMDLSVQAQFLKFIEEKSYRRLGDSKLRKSEFRLICATNKDLVQETRFGRFRLDLYFRIFVFPIIMPALRDRLADLPGLLRSILGEIGTGNEELPAEVLKSMESYSWPGNVRELRNVLERAVLLARGGALSHDYFPGLGPVTPSPGNEPAGRPSGGDNGLAGLEEVLRRFDGNVTRAAKALGISRMTFYRRLRKLKD